MTDSRTIQLGAHCRAVVSCTTGRGAVWLRLESENGPKLKVFVCGMSPEMAEAVAGTLEDVRDRVSETHQGNGIRIKVSWSVRQTDFICFIHIIFADAGAAATAVGAAAIFKEEPGHTPAKNLAAALRWAAAVAGGGMPSGDDSIKSADRKRDDLMKGMFS